MPVEGVTTKADEAGSTVLDSVVVAEPALHESIFEAFFRVHCKTPSEVTVGPVTTLLTAE